MITWIDAHSEDTWLHSKEGDFSAYELHTYGEIIHESEDCITIAGTVGTNNDLSTQHFTIPKGCIREIKDLQT